MEVLPPLDWDRTGKETWGEVFSKIRELGFFKFFRLLFRSKNSTVKEIDKLLKGKINKLKALMVVQGPGEFSALRIGVVTANALADSLNIPVCALKLEKNKEFLSEKEKLKNLFNQGVEQLAQGQTNDLVKPFYGVEPNIG